MFGPRAILKNEIGHPASSFKLVVSHLLQSAAGVHDRVASLLVVEDEVNNLEPFFLWKSQLFGRREGGVKVEGDSLEIRTVLDVFYGLAYGVNVEIVDSHVGSKIFAMAGGSVGFETGKGAFAAYPFVGFAYTVKADPDVVGYRSVKRTLSVGGDGTGEEAYISCQSAEGVDVIVPVVPQEGLAPFKINKTRTQRIAVFQLFFDLFITLVYRCGVVIDAAMFATEVAAVGDKDDALQGVALME